MKMQLEEKDSITFEELTAGATKRTAAACFLEILQLKTWDYIETVQRQPYDDISISSTDKLWKYTSSEIDVIDSEEVENRSSLMTTSTNNLKTFIFFNLIIYSLISFIWGKEKLSYSIGY